MKSMTSDPSELVTRLDMSFAPRHHKLIVISSRTSFTVIMCSLTSFLTWYGYFAPVYFVTYERMPSRENLIFHLKITDTTHDEITFKWKIWEYHWKICVEISCREIRELSLLIKILKTQNFLRQSSRNPWCPSRRFNLYDIRFSYMTVNIEM